MRYNPHLPVATKLTQEFQFALQNIVVLAVEAVVEVGMGGGIGGGGGDDGCDWEFR